MVDGADGAGVGGFQTAHDLKSEMPKDTRGEHKGSQQSRVTFKGGQFSRIALVEDIAAAAPVFEVQGAAFAVKTEQNCSNAGRGWWLLLYW